MRSFPIYRDNAELTSRGPGQVSPAGELLLPPSPPSLSFRGRGGAVQWTEGSDLNISVISSLDIIFLDPHWAIVDLSDRSFIILRGAL